MEYKNIILGGILKINLEYFSTYKYILANPTRSAYKIARDIGVDPKTIVINQSDDEFKLMESAKFFLATIALCFLSSALTSIISRVTISLRQLEIGVIIFVIVFSYVFYLVLRLMGNFEEGKSSFVRPYLYVISLCLLPLWIFTDLFNLYIIFPYLSDYGAGSCSPRSIGCLTELAGYKPDDVENFKQVFVGIIGFIGLCYLFHFLLLIEFVSIFKMMIAGAVMSILEIPLEYVFTYIFDALRFYKFLT